MQEAQGSITSYGVVKRELERFAERHRKGNKPEVLLLSGEWGGGKTHVVREVFDQEVLPATEKKSTHLWRKAKQGIKTLPKTQYAYMLLFGKNSIEDIKRELYLDVGSSSILGSLMGDGLKEANEHTKGHGKGSLAAISNVALTALALQRLKGAIVCIDDVERKGDNLAIKDVMGFVSYLREQHQCSVIVVMHDGVLEGKDKTTFDQYREKTFDLKLHLEMTADDAVRLIIREYKVDATYHETLIRRCVELDIKNLRTLQKIMRGVNLLHEDISKASTQAQDSLLSSLVFLMWSHDYAPNDEKVPPIEYVLPTTYSTHDDIFDALEQASLESQENKEKRKKKEDRWDKIQFEYGFRWDERQDAPIRHLVEHGFVDEEGVRKAIAFIEAELTEKALMDACFEAQKLAYATGFQENYTEVLETMYDSTIKAIHLLKADEVDDAVHLLRTCQRAQDADALIEAFFTTTERDNEENFWRRMQRRTGRRRDYQDAAFISRLLARRPGTPNQPTIQSIIEDGDYTDVECHFLAQKTVEEYKQFLMENPVHVKDYEDSLLQWRNIVNPTAEHQEITRKVIQAIQEIAAMNPMQAVRAAMLDIYPEPHDHPEEPQPEEV